MIKVIITSLLILVLNGCSYEPILLKKNYQFDLVEINSEGEKKINEIIESKLLQNTKKTSEIKYKILILSEKKREIVSSNREGDPTIFKITIKLKYNLRENDQIVLSNEIFKQSTYNNIKDKFELLEYEENIIKNLSEKLSDDILISIKSSIK